MTDDHPDTDLTDPDGEAEALRREIARLREELMAGRASRWVGAYRQLDAAIARAEAAEAMEAEFAAIMRHLGGVPFMRSMVEAQRNANGAYILYEDGSALIKVNSEAKVSPVEIPVPVAASRAPDPVAKAGSCQPGDLISRAAAVEACVNVRKIACDESEALGAMDCAASILALPAAPVVEAQPVAMPRSGFAESKDSTTHFINEANALTNDPKRESTTIGGAELDALVKRAHQAAAKCVTKDDAIIRELADTITALRAQPDWKAMAERLGKKLTKLDGELDSHGYQVEGVMRRLARAALSDLAKMKVE